MVGNIFKGQTTLKHQSVRIALAIQLHGRINIVVVSPSYTEGVVYAIQLYGVRSIMASTAVCGTASLSSILSVPTKARSPNYDLVARRCYQDSMKNLAGRPFGLAQTITTVRCLPRGRVDES